MPRTLVFGADGTPAASATTVEDLETILVECLAFLVAAVPQTQQNAAALVKAIIEAVPRERIAESIPSLQLPEPKGGN